MKKNLNFTCKTKHTLLCETFRSLYFESNIHFHAKKKNQLPVLNHIVEVQDRKMVIRIRLAEKIEKYEGGQNQSLGKIRQKMQASQSPLQVTSEKFVTPNEFNQ